MSFLSSLGNKIRNGFDDVGSIVTGQPAHGPAPVQAPTPIQPPVSQNPLPFLRQPSPSINLMGPQNPNPSISLSGASVTPSISVPTPSANPTYQAPPKLVVHAGILHDITHNPVTNTAGAIAKATIQPAVSLAKTDIINPTRQLAAQVSGNQEAQRNAQTQTNIDLGLGPQGTNFAGGVKHFVGNTAQIALTGLAPGASKAIEAPIESGLARVGASDLGTQIISHAVSNAPIGAAFNASGALANGGNANDVATAALQGAAAGATLGGIVPIAQRVAPVVASGTVKGLKATASTGKAIAADSAGGGTFRNPFSGPEYNPARTTPEQINPQIDQPQGVTPQSSSAKSRGSSSFANYTIDPLAALKQEALKYKSADEFVNSKVNAYHGSTNDRLTSLTPGSKTGLNEKRNLIYLTDNEKTAGDYAKTRGTDGSGLGELSASPTGTVYPAHVGGQILNAYDRSALDKLTQSPGFANLSGKTKNILTNDTGLSHAQLEANPELVNFLRENGVGAVSGHLSNGGGAKEIIALHPDNVKTKQQLTDLYNQAHAEANTHTSAEDIGRALGLTDEQMAQARLQNSTAQGKVAQNRAAARDTLPPEDNGIGSLQHERSPRPTAKENTAKNPMKVNIPEVEAGDYEKARSNAQLASSPVEYSAGQVTKALNKLAPAEKSTFWKAVEDPSLIKSKAMQEAVSRWKDLSNRVHATSQSLGGNTGYLENYARHNWDLTNPEDAARFEQLVNARGGASVDPYDFSGLNRQPRVFNTIKEGEDAGFKLKNPHNPGQDVIDYAKSSAYALKQQALQKGMTEADMNEPLKNRSFDLRNGKTLPLSERGNHEMRAYQDIGKGKLPNRAFRVANKKLKQTLLSASEFHPINISLLKAGPTEALAGHPVLAAKGVYGTFRSQIGRGYSDKLQESALKDGTVDAAARIGTPIKYGSDYASEGKTELGKQGVGEKAIFEKAMPAMHIRMVQGAIQDLEKRGISLDSPEARQLGDTINKTMGFINGELKNDNPHIQRQLSNLALAPQFTRAKWGVLKDAITRGGLSGKYARRAVVGNTLAVATISTGLGLLLGQKSDNLKDTVIKNLVHPSISTPFKDARGNTEEVGLPSTYISEAAGLGANIKRESNGHIGIDVKPGNIPGNLANYGRSRLSVLPGTALKVATNTDFGGKPLYDSNAPIGTKAIQAATTTTQGLLPIGLQGIGQNKTVQKFLPGTSDEIINANKSSANGTIKGIASAFGGTLRTDKTVGKGLQTQQYYDALAAATKGLGPNDKAAFASIHQQSKDAVTGKYIIQPTVFDSDAKANLYLAHPAVLAADTKLNQKLQSEGQSVDPFFKLPADQQKAYLEHETVNKNNTQQLAVDQQRYASWMPQFDKDRAVFYNSLPPGDPNKPKNPIPYPTESADVSKSFNEYNAITDPVQRGQYFGQHPELSQYMDQMTDYTNKVLTAQGLIPLKPYPKADAETESFLNTYMNNPTQRKSLKASNPTDYAKMSAYMQYVDEYEVAKNGALDQLQGQTPNQKELKGIKSLAQYDMVTNPDGSLALKYGTTGNGATTYGSVSALPQAGATSGTGSGYGSSSRRSLKAAKPRYLKNKKPHAHFVRKHKPRQYFASTNAQVKGVAHFVAPSKPKTIKLSS